MDEPLIKDVNKNAYDDCIQVRSIDRIERAVDKIAENTVSINKMLAVHEEKINRVDEQQKILIQDIKNVSVKVDDGDKQLLRSVNEIEMKISDEHEKELKETNEMLEEFDKRLSKLEQWKWFIVGIAGAIGYYIEHMNIFAMKN